MFNLVLRPTHTYREFMNHSYTQPNMSKPNSSSISKRTILTLYPALTRIEVPIAVTARVRIPQGKFSNEQHFSYFVLVSGWYKKCFDHTRFTCLVPRVMCKLRPMVQETQNNFRVTCFFCFWTRSSSFSFSCSNTVGALSLFSPVYNDNTISSLLWHQTGRKKFSWSLFLFGESYSATMHGYSWNHDFWVVVGEHPDSRFTVLFERLCPYYDCGRTTGNWFW